MISRDLIRWIVEVLANSHAVIHNQSTSEKNPEANDLVLSDYSLEYATALLMNLSLRSKGKDMCERLPEGLNIIKVLSEMMEHENLQVRTHVNGTLYSILTR